MRSYGQLRYHDGDGTVFGGGAWVINAEPNVTMRLKRVFAQVAPNREGALVLSATAETAADLEWVLSRWPMDMDDETRARLNEAANGFRAAQEAVDRILGGDRLPFDLEPTRTPREYQTVAADMALTTGSLLLGDDVGLGKTFSALLMLRHPEALPAVVVCPVHLQRQWVQELHDSFPTLHGHIVRKTAVYDPARVRGSHGHRPDVLIISYSKLSGWAEHLAGQVQTVIFDEAQELRHSGSHKYVAAGRLADAAKFVMGTTATPVYNYGGEVHNIMQVLRRDALGTRHEFIQEWGKELAGGKITVRDPRALGAHLREQNLMLRRTRKDVGRELGDINRVPHTVDADPEVIDREITDSVGLAEFILSGAGTRQERMKASGDLDWQMRRATGLAKAPYVSAFVKMLLESEPKVVLWGWHRDVYDLWVKDFDAAKIGYAMFTGSESPAAKDRMKQQFIDGEDCRVLIMSLRSGAGLNGLQNVCKVGVFGELDWSPAMHDQCLGRLHRDGQVDPVVGYFLTCDYGSDPTVMEVLGVKRGQAEPIRDPTIKLFEQMEAPGNRVRQLAQAVMRKRAA